MLGKLDSSELKAAQRGDLYQLMAVALTKSGQADQALDAWARAASASPNDATVQYQYGVAALNSGDLANAAKALQRSVDSAPNGDNRKALVNVLMQQGRRSSGSTKTEAYRRATATI